MNPELEAIQRQAKALAKMNEELTGASPAVEYWAKALNELTDAQDNGPARAAVIQAMLHVSLGAYAQLEGPASTARQLYLVALAFFDAAEGAKANGRHESGTLN